MGLLLAVGWLSASLSACSKSGAGPASVTGDYVYHYATGQVEVLSLQPDQTYTQRLFRTSSDYRRKAAAAFTHIQGWSQKGDSLTLQKCMIFSDPRHAGTALKFPVQKQSITATWLPPKGETDAGIEIINGSPYRFLRSDGKDSLH